MDSSNTLKHLKIRCYNSGYYIVVTLLVSVIVTNESENLVVWFEIELVLKCPSIWNNFIAIWNSPMGIYQEGATYGPRATSGPQRPIY